MKLIILCLILISLVSCEGVLWQGEERNMTDDAETVTITIIIHDEFAGYR